MKTKPPIIILIALLAACLEAHGAESAGATLVSGKAVYGEMAIEEAEITAFSGGTLAARTKSGYHGSFLLHLPQGIYQIKATGAISTGVEARGEISRLEIKPGTGRIDRLVIKLER